MDREELVRELEAIAPPDLAEEMDDGRIGLIIEGNEEIGRVACALDATPAVVERAARSGAGMLVVHHTPIWHPVTSITGPTAGLLNRVFRSGMNVYVMHTNFDRAPGGVNETLGEILGLERVEPLPLGLVGDCRLDGKEMARRLGCQLRIWGRLPDRFRLAVVGGAGFDPDLIAGAVALGAGAFLSSELKHAVMRSAPVVCIEATHYTLEAPAMVALAKRMGWEYIDDPPALEVVG
ncbi:MAG: Nif3-like dinuclear metal center hexameric protein [Methanoregulaceae archaeon]|nr:Nif3-like dinuclear metal center hexameric protein [Methanoregulaceae archaeon]